MAQADTADPSIRKMFVFFLPNLSEIYLKIEHFVKYT